MKYYEVLENPILLKKIAFWCIVGGILIVFVFLVALLLKGIGIYDGVLDMAITGQVGDFIGGFVGSIWSLASIVLFVAALKMQGEELKNQQIEIKYQTEEFRSNRIMTLIFKQAELSNTYLSKLQFYYLGNFHDGYNALIMVGRAVKRMVEKFDYVPTDDRVMIVSNLQSLIQGVNYKIYIEHIHQSNVLLMNLLATNDFTHSEKSYFLRLYKSLLHLTDLRNFCNLILPTLEIKCLKDNRNQETNWAELNPEDYKSTKEFYERLNTRLHEIVLFL
ncbi:hypothetical protein [Lacihabitans soyangensis]|uniref:Phage abortive infection protein n=1 Tax=Lacihabitans soyangensis TaxID=869394 RepID=A0AAE3H2A1_9BACT|nr:hypothetical protein [Lacihabitans soyangensis]MCP9762980.1 hypothetical protein [Lacihabitans soyangensis]